MDRRGTLAPILIDLPRVGIGAQHRLDALSNGPQPIGVWTHDAEVDQVSRVGSEDEL